VSDLIGEITQMRKVRGRSGDRGFAFRPGAAPLQGLCTGPNGPLGLISELGHAARAIRNWSGRVAMTPVVAGGLVKVATWRHDDNADQEDREEQKPEKEPAKGLTESDTFELEGII
jgi:hypothetical protein